MSLFIPCCWGEGRRGCSSEVPVSPALWVAGADFDKFWQSGTCLEASQLSDLEQPGNPRLWAQDCVSIANRARLFSNISSAFVPSPSPPMLRDCHFSWFFSPWPSPGNLNNKNESRAFEEHFLVCQWCGGHFLNASHLLLINSSQQPKVGYTASKRRARIWTQADCCQNLCSSLPSCTADSMSFS